MANNEKVLKPVPEPTLAVFLVGDSIKFIPKPWPRNKLKEALIDTLNAFGDPWLVCECTLDDVRDKNNSEWLTVTRIAMEARKEYSKINNSYSGTKETEKDTDANSSLLQKAKYEDDTDTFCLIGINEDNKPEILSTKKKWPTQFANFEGKGKKYETLLYLEEKISKPLVTTLEIDAVEFKMKVPTIVIVVEGGLETIGHVAEAVQKHIPVLLVRGSGMAADLIGYCLESQRSQFDPKQHLKGVLETHAPLLFGICFAEEDLTKLEKDINIIIQYKSKVAEFNILTDSVTSLKDRVTESIIRVWSLSQLKGEKTADLQPYQPTLPNESANGKPPSATKSSHSINQRSRKVAPIYDTAMRPKTPTARVVSPSSQPSSETSTDTEGKGERKLSPVACCMLYQILQAKHVDLKTETKLGKSLLCYALKENLTDIVELLIDKGIKLEWSDGDMNDTNYNDGRSLYKQMEKERKKCEAKQTRTCIAEIVQLPREELKKKKDAWKIGCALISYSAVHKPKGADSKLMTPSDFLLWAVLTNKMDMAEIFWKRSHEPILTALIASAILRKMAGKAHGLAEPAMEKEMLLHSRVFRQRAIDVTQKMYELNEQEAVFVLEGENKVPVWGIRENALEFSQERKIYSFVAHHVPQRTFGRIFHGGDFFHHDDIAKPKPTKTCCCLKLLYHDKKKISLFLAIVKAPVMKFITHYFFFGLFLVCLSAFVMTNITKEKWPIDEKSVYEYCSYLFLFADIMEEYVPPTINTLMLKELMRFVVVMFILIVSVGVFYHANLYPNHYDMFSTLGIQHWSVWKILYLPYWSIYGEFKDEISGELPDSQACSTNQTEYMNNPDIVRCPEKDWTVSVLSVFFVLILNLLLVNLIIAMFSFRFEEIKENSDTFWRFHRSQVIMEFRKRIPVPLNLVCRPITSIYSCCVCRRDRKQKEKDTNVRAELDEKQQILAQRWMLSESDALQLFKNE
ncbi:transient receptor potential cation channel subfamily M member 2-like isoform X4 [Argopecten irradians]|uniref:transient receptor potential cation channel subfamily M member 2-like isoform X4 n=1 Tax=Argopecten irradians TaxID=31199 RepID=UPI0037180FEC